MEESDEGDKMSLSEEMNKAYVEGHKPQHAIVKCIKPQTNWPNAGALTVGKIYDAYFCADSYSWYVVINNEAYYYDGKKPDFITEDFPQLEKLLFIGRKKCSLK